MLFRRSHCVALAMAILALTLSADAFARAGGGGSFGSRGSRTFSAPPVTTTAPRPAAPFERSGLPNQGFPSAAAPPARGFFSGGFGRGLIGGFLGAGLFGLLFGNGLFGGLGDGISVIGLIIQFGLLFLLFKFVMGLIRSPRQPAFSAGPPFNRGSGGPAPRPASFAASAPLQVQPADFDMFQRRLGEVQAAYGAEDIEGLRRIATAETASRLADEIAGNARRGLVNRLSDIRLLQGDLAEAWREAAGEFATVAMRYSLIDATVERATGRLMSGSATNPQEVTELWTFTRAPGGGPADWKLSAIQQT